MKAVPKVLLQTDAPPLFLGTRLPMRQENVLQGPQGKEFPVQPEALQRNADLVATAQEFLPGKPHAVKTYLWGGSVGRELDCSGFLQTVYRACGTQLPRDADQQQAYSRPVAPTLDKIDQLQVGDLIFFSEKREYADHIGMFIGDGKFIHCSSGGPYPGVKINTLVGGGEYDKKLQAMYYGAGRPPR
jgi:gamma-D-glutamyl-L-lysine dipeptidyl-peptidase